MPSRRSPSLVCLVSVILLGSILISGRSWAQPLTDPYEILTKHYEAMGGLERLKTERTRYFEATISVYGLEGTVREWDETPIQKRQEVDIKVFKQISGDNGKFAWTVDQNGKLQIQKDESTLNKRKVDELMAVYDHLNRDSKNFTLTFEGTEKVGTADCYVVKIANSINKDYMLFYVNTSNLYLEKMTRVSPDQELRAVFSDYRNVNGIQVAFRQENEIAPIGQKQTVQITKYESNIAIDPALFEPPGEDVKDFQFTNGVSAENIPFKYIGEHMFLDVTVNCDKRLWVLDTGASVTVIDSAYAAQIGLESAGSIKASGAGQTVEASFVKLPPFSIPGIQFNEQQVASISLSGLFKRAGLDVVGVLGYDFLSRFVTGVDYAGKTLSFYDPAAYVYKGNGKVVDAPLKDNLFMVPMSVDGKYSGLWSLDLGASGTSFFYGFADENQILGRPGVDGVAGGAGGYFTVRASRYGQVDIAGYTLSNQVISAPLEKTSGALGSKEGTGNIGNDILRHLVLYLDYKDQRVIFEKGKDFDREFPNGKSGLGFMNADDGSIEVFYVSSGTPADKAGFKKGDVLKSINGIPVERLAGVIAISELFKEAAGTEYTMRIAREGKVQTLKLKLKDLY